jgi:hypothetical protein
MNSEPKPFGAGACCVEEKEQKLREDKIIFFASVSVLILVSSFAPPYCNQSAAVAPRGCITIVGPPDR